MLCRKRKAAGRGDFSITSGSMSCKERAALSVGEELGVVDEWHIKPGRKKDGKEKKDGRFGI